MFCPTTSECLFADLGHLRTRCELRLINLAELEFQEMRELAEYVT